MRRLPSRWSIAVLLAAVGWLTWLGLPRQPPQEEWPSAAAAPAAMVPRLAAGIGAAWAQGERQQTWEAAKILVEGYPESPEARRLSPALTRLQAEALLERRARKWAYKDLNVPGWGRLAEAHLPSEALAFSPDAASSFLVARTGALPRHTAVFLVPGLRVPPACVDPQGCVLTVLHGADETPLRWLPVPEQDGWLQASHPQRVLEWLARGEDLALAWPGLKEPLTFESGGLDAARLGLQPPP